MATATDPDSEGKTLAASDVCGACKTYVAEQLCEICPVTLCSICARAHKNIKLTADHALVDIRKTDTRVTSSQAASSIGQCPLHKQQQYTTFCKDCIQLACDLCKPNHTGHSLQSLNGDPKLCQRVCSKHIQHLLDDLHEIEELKSVLENNIETYDEAVIVVDKWELELIQMVRDKTAKLRQKIKELKDKRIDQLSGKLNGLMGKLKEIDDTISTLTNIRKSTDYQILVNELSASQDLIYKLEECKSSIQPARSFIGINDVLSNGNKMQDVGQDLDALLLLTKIDDLDSGPKPVASWVFNASNGGKDLSQFAENPVIMSNIKYGPGPNEELNGAAILPTAKDQSMIVQNPSIKLQFSKEMTYFIHVYIKDSNEGSLFEYMGSDMFLIVSPDLTSLVFKCKNTRLEATSVLTENSWNRITLVCTAQNVSMYVNSKLVKSGSVSTDLSPTQQGDIHFGKDNYCKIEGRIASARFFNVALTESEVLSLK